MAPDEAPPARIEVEADDGDDQITPLDYNIIVSPVVYPLEALYRKMSENKVVIPDSQRQYAWDRPRASRLIESFIMDLPVPAVFVSEQKDQKLVVIDGRHRLETVRRFFDEEFHEGRNGQGAQKFRLTGINPSGRLSNKAFSDLDPADQRMFRNTILRVVVIRQLDPDRNPAAIHHIFERLNKAQSEPSSQDIRSCLYAGKLNDMLASFNKIDKWRLLFGSRHPDERQNDVELILRYTALFHNLAEYKDPMKDFLSSFMHNNRNPSDEFVFEERTRFVRTCALLLDGLGGRSLGQHGRINPSVFDSLFVTIAGNPDACGTGDLAGRIRRLLSDREFVKSTTHATTDPLSVARRMDLAKAALCGGSH